MKSKSKSKSQRSKTKRKTQLSISQRRNNRLPGSNKKEEEEEERKNIGECTERLASVNISPDKRKKLCNAIIGIDDSAADDSAADDDITQKWKEFTHIISKEISLLEEIYKTIKSDELCFLHHIHFEIDYTIDPETDKKMLYKQFSIDQHLGKQTHLTEQLDPELYYKTNIENCKHQYMAIPLNYRFKGEPSGHANMLIIHKDENTIKVEHFEPHGESYSLDDENDNTKINQYTDHLVHSLFVRNGYTKEDIEIIHPEQLCKLNKSNHKQLQQLLKGTEFSGTCVIFSMWYSFYRLLYPSLSSEEVYRQMNDRLERSTNKTETIKMIIQTFLSLIKINIDDHTVSGERKMGKTSQYKIKKIRGIVEPETEDNIERFLTGDIATMEKMMEDGMITNINVQDKNGGYTALMAQTLYGEIAEMEWLLKKKANVDLQGSDGMSAIFLAIYNGDLDKVKLLLRYNANLKIMEKSGDTPLTYAMKIKDAMKIKENKIILMLEEAIQKGEPDSEYNIEKFIIGDLKTMKEMLESGRITNVDVQAKGGKYLPFFSALIHKASNGNIAEFEWLLEHRANVDLQDKDGMSAIFYAIFYSDVDRVKLLLKSNPNLNMKEKSGHTPLTYAIKLKRKKIIPILEEAMKAMKS